MWRQIVLAAALASGAAAQPAYDVVLRGGRLIDPRQALDAPRELAIRDGRVALVAEPGAIPSGAGRLELDAAGLVITPGLVDIHVHLFATTGQAGAWAGDNSVWPDGFSFRTGTTTMADAGTAGWRNFETFRHTVLDRVETRVFAMINIAGLGMFTNIVEQHPEDMEPERVAAMAKKHRDLVVGIKTAHFEGPGWVAVERAVEAGRLAGLPVMVDFGYFRPERPYWQLVTEKLRPGDISTHMFRGPAPWVDERGQLYDYLRRARERGVKFDVGHGGGSFAFRNAVPAVAQGFWPDSISTDLHTGSMNAAMMDLPTTMSKFLALGMPLREVVARATHLPAALIGHPELGHLGVGAPADVAVWRIREGDFGFADAHGGRLMGRRRLECELTLREGRLVWDLNGRAATDYRKLPAGYGVRAGETISPPPR